METATNISCFLEKVIVENDLTQTHEEIFVRTQT